MRRLLLVMITLALLAGALAIGRARRERTDGAPPRPSPAGAPAREAAGEAATLQGAPTGPMTDTPTDTPTASAADGSPIVPLQGVVRGDLGEAVAGARVFLFAKSDLDTRVADAETDEEGRFDLGYHDARGHWLGAVAPGHLPGHLDGDALEANGVLALTLEPGPEIRVTVSDGEGGALDLDTTIEVRTAGTGSRWPHPEANWSQSHEAVIAAGDREARLRIGTRGPVRVEARYGNVMPVVEPDDPSFETPPAYVAFAIRPSCVLDITVLDAESGEPLERGFSFRLLRGDDLVTGGSKTVPGGRLTMGYRLRPGAYEFQAWAHGYRRHEGTAITLTQAGEAKAVEVRLERDPTLGSLRVSLPALAQLPTIPAHDGTSRAPPAHFLFLRSPTQAPFDWAPDRAERPAWGSLRGEKARESDTDYLFTFVPEGEVFLLVKEPRARHVAFVPRIRVRAGRLETVTVDLEPGFLVHVGRYVPEAGTTRSFFVRHPVYGALPAYLHQEFSSSLWQPGQVPHRQVWIGPYPGPEVEIVVVDEAGETVTHAVRGEDD